MKALILALVLVVAVPTTASAYFYGPGAVSCGDFLEETAGEKRLGAHGFPFVFWCQGFMSRLGMEQKTDIPALKEAGPICHFLIKDCREHPFEPVMMACTRLFAELRKGPIKQ